MTSSESVASCASIWKIDSLRSITTCAITVFILVCRKDLKYLMSFSCDKSASVPTSFKSSFFGSLTASAISPEAPMDSGNINSGSINCILELVPHGIPICSTRLMKYTSAWNGLSPPDGMFIILLSSGIFWVSSSYLPGRNESSACPFKKKIASCNS